MNRACTWHFTLKIAHRSTLFIKPRSRQADKTMARPVRDRTYHANYYGAFVLDPDGHNVEAVCHTAE